MVKTNHKMEKNKMKIAIITKVIPKGLSNIISDKVGGKSMRPPPKVTKKKNY